MSSMHMFFNTAIEHDNSLENFGNLCLGSIRVFFGGRSFKILNGAFQEKAKSNTTLAKTIRLALAIIFFVPSVIIGSIAKALSRFNKKTRDLSDQLAYQLMHPTTKSHIHRDLLFANDPGFKTIVNEWGANSLQLFFDGEKGDTIEDIALISENNKELNKQLKSYLLKPKFNGLKDPCTNPSKIRIGDKTYIAAKTPAKESIPNFIQSIIDENVDTVVNLTTSDEVGSDGYSYWTETIEFEKDTKIEHIKRTTLFTNDEASQRLDLVKLKISQGTESKEINMYHYTGWPNDNGPDLDGFNRLVDELQPQEQPKIRTNESPLFVHCKTGNEKTEILIAADSLRYDLKKHSRKLIIKNEILNVRPNIFGRLAEMRLQSRHFPDNDTQIQFLHSATAQFMLDLSYINE